MRIDSLEVYARPQQEVANEILNTSSSSAASVPAAGPASGQLRAGASIQGGAVEAPKLPGSFRQLLQTGQDLLAQAVLTRVQLGLNSGGSDVHEFVHSFIRSFVQSYACTHSVSQSASQPKISTSDSHTRACTQVGLMFMKSFIEQTLYALCLYFVYLKSLNPCLPRTPFTESCGCPCMPCGPLIPVRVSSWHGPVHSFIRSFIQSFIHSSIQSYIHSFVCMYSLSQSASQQKINTSDSHTRACTQVGLMFMNSFIHMHVFTQSVSQPAKNQYVRQPHSGRQAPVALGHMRVTVNNGRQCCVSSR